MAPLRVAIVAASLRILGGQAVQASRLLSRWRRSFEIDAWLVPINPAPPRLLQPLMRVKYVRTLVTQLLYWPLLIRELKHADLVHVFSASYSSFFLAPLPAILIAKAYGKPVLLNYHSGEAPDHLRRSAFARAVLRMCDLNVVPSTFLQQAFADAGIPADVVPNTLDTGGFRYRARDPLAPHLISTRNFEPLYNLPCTLRAFQRIQRVRPGATLCLVGSGSQDMALRAMASSLGLRNVTFAGRVDQAAIARFYDAADIYVQTSTIDNLPLSVLEAFSSGLPAVATAVGGVPTMIDHGVNGLLVADGDDEALAREVLWLLEHPDNARQMAERAQQGCERYEWPSVREKWLAAYRTVMNPSARRIGRSLGAGAPTR